MIRKLTNKNGQISDSESITDLSNITDTEESEDDSETVKSETLTTETESFNLSKSKNDKPSSFQYQHNSCFISNGAYFQQSLQEQFSTKNKIIAFIEKDIFLLNHYESQAFKNIHHAIEVITPYHIFDKMVDDIKFEGSNININLEDDIQRIEKVFLSFIGNTIIETNQNSSFLSQLLLFHEQRYFINKLNQGKKKDAITEGKTVKKIKTLRKSNLKEFNDTKIHNNNNNKGFLTIKKPNYSYTYGSPYNIHFKFKKH